MHRPEYGKTELEAVVHHMKLGINKEKLENRIKEEFQAIYGPKAKLCDATARYQDWAKDDKAFPLLGQVGPVAGLRVIQHGVVCLICSGDRPHCAINVDSIQTHQSNKHPGFQVQKNGVYFKIVPIQTFCGGNYLSYFAIPGGLSINTTLSATIPGPDSDLEPDLLDNDDEDPWDRAIRKDAEKSLGVSAGTSRMDILDEKTLIPFLRDYRVHAFLSQWSREECLSLSSVTQRGKAPMPLRRLYQAVTETFLADCAMAVKMNPAVRRLIMHCNP